jgi:hypothetical protein
VTQEQQDEQTKSD